METTMMKTDLNKALPTNKQALQLAEMDDTAALMSRAGQLRDQHFRNLVTYSRKVFIPLTQLCREVCHYCTFAQTPKKVKSLYMSVEEELTSVREAEAMGCKEGSVVHSERAPGRSLQGRA